MESILLYLIPGIVTAVIIKIQRPTIPKERSTYHSIVSMIIYSLITYGVMVCLMIIYLSVFMKFDFWNIELKDVLSRSNIMEMNIYIIFLLIWLSIVVSVKLILKWMLQAEKNNGHTYGSAAYMKSWKEYSKYEKNNSSKAVKIYHDGILVTQGFVLVDFVYPWQNYREIILYNEIDFDNEDFIYQYPSYTYYSIEDKYKIEVYELKEEPKFEQ